MATAVRRHSIVNPARRHRPGARKNKPRRHMTDKQIRHFGTKRQRAALKTRRRKNAGGKIITGYGSTVMNRAKRKRNAPHGSGGRVIAGYGSTTMNSGRRRKNASGQNSKHVVIVNRKKNRAAAHRRRTKRSNPGEILSLTLGNPAKRRKNVAATKRNKRQRHATASNPRRRHSRRQNPVMRNRRRRHNVRHRHIRRNPGGLNMPSLVTDGLFVVGGLVGSRLLTQMVLGTSNVGVMGYVGNAAAGAALATVAHMMTKNPRVTGAIVTGTAAGIVARLLQDYTPLGTYLTQAGFGDYAGGGAHGVGLYLPSNAVVPQRYVDAANSAQVQIPAGWAPTVVQSAGAAVGMAGLYDGGGSSLY